MSNVRLDVVEGEKVLVPHPHVSGPAPNSAPWVHFYVMGAPDEARSFLPTGGPPRAFCTIDPRQDDGPETRRRRGLLLFTTKAHLLRHSGRQIAVADKGQAKTSFLPLFS